MEGFEKQKLGRNDLPTKLKKKTRLKFFQRLVEIFSTKNVAELELDSGEGHP